MIYAHRKLLYYSETERYPSFKYCKSGNFHVEIIHVVNIHVDLFSWVYGTHENIFNMNLFQHDYLRSYNHCTCTVDITHKY